MNRTRIHFLPWTCFYLQTFVLGEAQSWYCVGKYHWDIFRSRDFTCLCSKKCFLQNHVHMEDRREKETQFKALRYQDEMYLNPFMWLLMKVLGHMVWFCIYFLWGLKDSFLIQSFIDLNHGSVWRPYRLLIILSYFYFLSLSCSSSHYKVFLDMLNLCHVVSSCFKSQPFW